ncbi:hypothetical protein CP532_3059 [Ophiocordyceps camponoti-leonardi (nom. inval.)]|nr:hypothetical protein CP532_3059 [Ophiocordyceps camponoti-leonardi (nom. inval.)]
MLLSSWTFSIFTFFLAHLLWTQQGYAESTTPSPRAKNAASEPGEGYYYTVVNGYRQVATRGLPPAVPPSGRIYRQLNVLVSTREFYGMTLTLFYPTREEAINAWLEQHRQSLDIPDNRQGGVKGLGILAILPSTQVLQRIDNNDASRAHMSSARITARDMRFVMDLPPQQPDTWIDHVRTHGWERNTKADKNVAAVKKCMQKARMRSGDAGRSGANNNPGPSGVNNPGPSGDSLRQRLFGNVVRPDGSAGAGIFCTPEALDILNRLPPNGPPSGAARQTPTENQSAETERLEGTRREMKSRLCQTGASSRPPSDDGQQCTQAVDDYIRELQSLTPQQRASTVASTIQFCGRPGTSREGMNGAVGPSYGIVGAQGGSEDGRKRLRDGLLSAYALSEQVQCNRPVNPSIRDTVYPVSEITPADPQQENQPGPSRLPQQLLEEDIILEMRQFNGTERENASMTQARNNVENALALPEVQMEDRDCMEVMLHFSSPRRKRSLAKESKAGK